MQVNPVQIIMTFTKDRKDISWKTALKKSWFWVWGFRALNAINNNMRKLHWTDGPNTQRQSSRLHLKYFSLCPRQQPQAQSQIAKGWKGLPAVPSVNKLMKNSVETWSNQEKWPKHLTSCVSILRVRGPCTLSQSPTPCKYLQLVNHDLSKFDSPLPGEVSNL